MISIETISFPNVGAIISKLPNNVYTPLKNYMEEYLKDRSTLEKYNDTLAGHMEEEYELNSQGKNILSSYLIWLATQFNSRFPLSMFDDHVSLNMLPNIPVNFELTNIWVNVQKKHEFNPIHRHGGSLSFVIWMNIPYVLKDELNHKNVVNCTSPENSLFSFHYTNTLGDILTRRLPIDHTFEGTIAMFPARMRHSVNPFYTSDGERISISGNLKAIEVLP